MQVVAYAEYDDRREKLGVFAIEGIHEVANNDVSLKEGSSLPKVTIGFEFSRSGLFLLNKAEARVEELYVIEEKPIKSKLNKTNSTTE